MNEQDLRDRLELTVATDLGEPPIDPTADLRRGRTRLRRRRLAGAFVAATSVAAVAALGTQVGLDSSTGKEPPAAGAAQPAPPSVAAAVREHARDAVLIKRMNDVLHRHVDPDRDFTRAPATTQEEGTVTITHQWHEKRGVGLLYYSVADARRAPAKETWCGPGYSTRNLVRITCSTTRAPDGRPIVVGVAAKTVNRQGIPYAGSGGQFVRYVRPDGRVVVVALLRMNTIERVADSIPGGRPGVAAPSANLDQLVGAAIDPMLTFPK